METGTLIMGAILIAICLMPFILLGLSRKKREKQLLHSLTNIAEKQNCQISYHENCRELIIGIDESNHYLFFFKHENEKGTDQYVHLTEIQNCKLVNKSRAINKKENNVMVIDKLELSFRPIDKNKNEFSWEFYNSEVSSHLDDELQLLEKWVKIVNNQIQLKKNSNSKPKTCTKVVQAKVQYRERELSR